MPTKQDMLGVQDFGGNAEVGATAPADVQQPDVFDMSGAEPVSDEEVQQEPEVFDLSGANYVFSLEEAERAGVDKKLPLSFDEPDAPMSAYIFGDTMQKEDVVKQFVHELGALEGTKAHVGIDSNNITLPYGIVPDSVEYDGQVIRPRGWKGELNPEKLRPETATKWGISRADYDSDEDWAAALVTDRMNKVDRFVPDLADDGARLAVTSSVWNTGFNGLRWSGFRETIEQLKEAPEDRDPASVIGWAKHSYAMGKPVFGLFKRRIMDANLALPQDDRITELKQEKAYKEGGRWFTKFVAMRNGEVVREFVLKGKPATNRERIVKLGET